jgi:hypothetical protein
MTKNMASGLSITALIYFADFQETPIQETAALQPNPPPVRPNRQQQLLPMQRLKNFHLNVTF